MKLCEADRDSTRFLWLSDAHDPTSALTAYRFKVGPFGTVSSPFMLNTTLDLHLSKFSTQVAQDMKTNLYVNNLISGCNSEKEAIDYYKKARFILCEAKFNLGHGRLIVLNYVQSLKRIRLMIIMNVSTY